MWDTDRDGKLSKKDMKEHYKRLPVNNVNGLAANAIMFKMLDDKKDGVLTKEDFVANPKAAQRISKLLISSNYQRFLTKENFPEFAKCLNAAYDPAKHRRK
jgi:Ca2+-binding EF-hand superfamily protein